MEQSTSRHGHLQASARPLYRLALVLVLGHIFWKWVNLDNSMDSNQECGIGFGNSPGSLFHFLAYSRKIGNRRSSEGLRSFKASRGTNLLVLIILAGDIEMNPGPRVPGLLGPKPFRPGTPRPKSIFLLGPLGQGLLGPVTKNTLFVAYNGKQMYI